jgi:hypothetical protein
VGRFRLGGFTALVVLACAAPAQAATQVHWAASNYPQVPWLYVSAAPGTVNDIEITAEEKLPGQPQVVRVVDRNDTLTTIAPVPPGVCDYPVSSCSVPCEIVGPHEARCALADGYTYQEPVDEKLIRQMDPTRTLDPTTPTSRPKAETFKRVETRLNGGADVYTDHEIPGARVEALYGASGTTYRLGGGTAFAGTGDRVEFIDQEPVIGGGHVTLVGSPDVFADNGSRQSIDCRATPDRTRVHVDALDEVDCGGWQQDGPLP